MGDIVVGAIELKTGTVHANEIVSKLSNGLLIACRLLHEHRRSFAGIRFNAILLHRGIHLSEYRVITSQRIRFDGNSTVITVKRCGSDFTGLTT